MVTPPRQRNRLNYSFDDQDNYYNKTTTTNSGDKDDEFTNASNDRNSSFDSIDTKNELARSLWR